MKNLHQWFDVDEHLRLLTNRKIPMNIIHERLAIIFNEWALRYSKNPEEFGEILNEDGKPVEDYGEQCAIYFCEIANELDSKGLLPKPETT